MAAAVVASLTWLQRAYRNLAALGVAETRDSPASAIRARPRSTRSPGTIAVREGGRLCDLAPTALALLGLAQPAEMTGAGLLKPSR